MSIITSGSSNYPYDYDLNPSVSGATIAYVLDQLRDVQTGIINQSGDIVIAKQINSIYTILQAVEQTLGLNVNVPFTSLAERLNYLQYSGLQAYLALSGGSIFGDLHIINSSGLYTNSIVSNGMLMQNVLNGMTINNTGVFALNSSGNINLTAIGNTNIDLTSNTLTTNNTNTYLVSTNDLNESGNIINLNAGDRVNVASANGLWVSGDIIPQNDGSYDLGSTLRYFDEIFVNTINSTGADAKYVLKAGDTVLGNLALNTGISIDIVESGTGYIGQASSPIGEVYTKNLYASFVSGLSPITFNSDININTGINITFAESGTSNIGDASFPLGTIWVDTLNVLSGIGSAPYVTTSGDTMTGSLVMNTGSNIELVSGTIYPTTSGVGTVGTSGNYFDEVFTNNVNGKPFGLTKFNEPLVGAINGINQFYTFANIPVLDSSMVFVSGLLVNPITDYTISGSGLTFTSLTPTTQPVAGFYVY